MVRAGHPPAEEAAELEAERIGDPLVAAERRDLPEHAVPVGLLLVAVCHSTQVAGDGSSLSKRVLARRRIECVWRCRVTHGRAVAERPDARQSVDSQGCIDDDVTPFVERQYEFPEERVRLDSSRPDEGRRRDSLAV